MARTIIDLKSVGIRYDSHIVLNDASVSIEEGESIVMIGPSGQGKTSLIKVIAGLLEPQVGTVLVDGVNLYQADARSTIAVLRKMGMLFQKNALFDSLTCGENIAFPLRETSSLDERQISEKVEYFLEAVGIPHSKNLFPDEISGGMQKRLGIARALALDPKIIFYDDPTAGLDPITSKRIIELILELRKRNGTTVVAITNDINRAYQMADRILMVVDRGILETGSPEETKRHPDARVQQFIKGSLEGPLTALG